MKRFGWVIGVCLGISSAQAKDMSGQFSVHALGVKVGDLAMAGSASSSTYTVSSQFVTSGLVATVAGVKFVLKANGTRKGPVFRSSRYSEDMDTGQRESRVSLRWSGGVAKASGSAIDKNKAFPVSKAQQRGAVDPLTAMFMVVRDQTSDEICKMNQKIYDGERLTQIVLTNRNTRGNKVLCTGQYRRIAGYSPETLRERSQFALTVTYEPAGDLMRATRVQADTIYGKAKLQRR